MEVEAEAKAEVEAEVKSSYTALIISSSLHLAGEELKKIRL